MDHCNFKKIMAHGMRLANPVSSITAKPLLAIVLTERNEKIRVITAYELDASQKRDYLERLLHED